jgi:DNA-directed RNA polymerase subunit RPC12/RpoP
MPQRCQDCQKVTLPDDVTEKSATQCQHCQSMNLECDHPSGYYSKTKYCFICSTCGHEYYSGLKSLRKFARNNTRLPEFKKILESDPLNIKSQGQQK